MKTIINFNNTLMHHVLNISDTRMHWQPSFDQEWQKEQEYSSKRPYQNTINTERTKLYIKNMMSIRCKIVVKAILETLGIKYTSVELGEVEITENLDEAKRSELKSILYEFGLELFEDKKSVLAEKIKNIIIDMIHCSDELPRIKFSDYLSKKLNHNYSYLSRLFSNITGTTIEHCVMIHKIERVKEFLFYDELTLSEIAYKLDYSSLAHLSNQFKKITGLTPSRFKEMKQKRIMVREDL